VRIQAHARANFGSLLRATEDGGLARVDCPDTQTGAIRHVICAAGRDGDDYIAKPFCRLADSKSYNAEVHCTETPKRNMGTSLRGSTCFATLGYTFTAALPPSAQSADPVTKLDMSLARNSAARAISSG